MRKGGGSKVGSAGATASKSYRNCKYVQVPLITHLSPKPPCYLSSLLIFLRIFAIVAFGGCQYCNLRAR